MSLVNSFIDISEGSMANHLSKLPLSDRNWFNVLFLFMGVCLEVVLNLIRSEVAVLEIAVEVVLILLVV